MMKPGIIGTYHQHLGENGRILGLILDALPNKYLGVPFPIRIYRISFNFCLYNYVQTYFIYIYTYCKRITSTLHQALPKNLVP